MNNQPAGLYGPFNSANSIYQNPTAQRYSPIMSQQQLAEAYSRLQSADGSNGQRTVIADISAELAQLSDDEKAFLASSPEYKAAEAKYREAFSAFLIQRFANDFLQGNQPVMENYLKAIRSAKDAYKSRFAVDVADLSKKNDDLMKMNESLQKQLESIQRKLDGGDL